MGRRRIDGLRREEVAAAAGISVDYYTRLEQGRERNPSNGVLNALARVLRLGPDATRHLVHLRDGRHATAVHRAFDAELTERLSALVDSVAPNPAYVLDRLSFMTAANAEGLALFEGFADLAPDQRNTCRYLFTDPRAREVFVEWEVVARGAVAHLRAANSDDLGSPDLRGLVDELASQSEHFHSWWSEHVVERRRASVARIRTSQGVVARRYEVLHLPDDDLRVTLWLPSA